MPLSTASAAAVWERLIAAYDPFEPGHILRARAPRLAFALAARPAAKAMVALAEPWRPWRGVAARLLWTYYRTVKRRDGAPINPTPANPTR